MVCSQALALSRNPLAPRLNVKHLNSGPKSPNDRAQAISYRAGAYQFLKIFIINFIDTKRAFFIAIGLIVFERRAPEQSFLQCKCLD